METDEGDWEWRFVVHDTSIESEEKRPILTLAFPEARGKAPYATF